MAWERRQRGGVYYTRSRRVGGRVVREYVGSGELGRFAEMIDAEQREERERKVQKFKADQSSLINLDIRLDSVNRDCRSLVAAQLVLAGFHRHKGQWRMRRGEE